MLNSKRHAHSSFASVSIHQYRKIIAGIFKQYGFATSGLFAHPIGDLSHFQFWIHISFDTDQFPGLFQCVNKMLLIFIRHTWEKLLKGTTRPKALLFDKSKLEFSNGNYSILVGNSYEGIIVNGSINSGWNAWELNFFQSWVTYFSTHLPGNRYYFSCCPRRYQTSSTTIATAYPVS